jgi:type IV secretory pathway TraG/TraD family ATPase VirD4
MSEYTYNTVYDYFKHYLREASSATRKRWGIALILFLLLWGIGSWYSLEGVAGLAAMKSPAARVISAAIMGPMGLVWAFLKATGAIQETGDDPVAFWFFVALTPGAILYGIHLYLSQSPNPESVRQWEARRERKAQGQLDNEEVVEKLATDVGIPLATVLDRKKKAVSVGLDFSIAEGHALVAGPTRSGKGLHLTQTLLQWPAAAVVVDPKGEQYRRTAALRAMHYGPVYHLPGDAIKLSHLYNLLNSDDIKDLHDQLLQPEQDSQRIFADKSLSLFEAVGHFAHERKRDAVRVLLDAASDEFSTVLRGLESVPAARREARKFTNDLAPEIFNQDRFVASAYGTFTTRLYNYQKHIDTIAPRRAFNCVPLDWVQKRATIYITYNLTELQGAGGVVAAILAGLMRFHMAHTSLPYRMLVAVDELAAVRLRNLETYLATVGGYGITMLLYTQSIAQLEGIYGRSGTEAILANTAHQVWYPPNELETARRVSALYGTQRRPNRSYSSARRYPTGGQAGQGAGYQDYSVGQTMREEPLLKPTEVMALPKDQVIVITEKDRQYRFVGQRVNPLDQVKNAPPPPTPRQVVPAERVYTDWLPSPSPAADSPTLPPGGDGTNSGDNPQSSTPPPVGDGGAGKKPLK